MNVFRKRTPESKRHRKSLPKTERTNAVHAETANDFLEADIDTNNEILRKVFANCSDVVFRSIPGDEVSKLLLVYVDGMVDTKVLDESVLKPWIYHGLPQGFCKLNTLAQVLEKQLVAILQTKTVATVSEVVQGVLKANVAILADGEDKALIADIKGFETRSVSYPTTESVVRGPKDSFTENIRTNTMLLRRRIASSRLKMESFSVGELTQTDVILAYIEDLAVAPVVESVRDKLRTRSQPGVLDSAYITEYLESDPFSPFPQIVDTERPDVVVAHLLEGKVAILVDGSPFSLLLPITFWAGLQSPDDYYERFNYVVARRLVRYVMAVISLTLPAIYVALTTYNPDMLPNSLYQSIATARERSPFPTVIETALSEFVFEGLQEAGLRMPSQLGPIVSIVGALVIGEAAVRADFISAPIVIVVSMTGIASYVIPRYTFGTPFRLLRFGLLLLAGILGVYGLSLGLIAILIHIVTLESFGLPYFTPVAPLVSRHIQDVFLRTPHWMRLTRRRKQAAK